MKKIILPIAALALALSACTNYEEQLTALHKSFDSLKEVADNNENSWNELSQTLADITTNINDIKDRQGIVNVNIAEGANKAQIKDDLNAIEEKMEENKKKIASLQAALNKSRKDASSFNAIIEELKRTVATQAAEIESLRKSLQEKDVEIGFLHKTIDKVTSSMDSINNVKKKVEDNLAQTTEKLQTGYYIVSDKSTLKSRGLIKTGLFKGVKATGKVDGNFTKVNITEVNSIDLKTRKATVVTSHPEGSYTLTEDASGNITLVINDKTAFWSMSKSLIVIGK